MKSRETKFEQLAHSWEANAAAWSKAVDEGRISSRVLATNAAVVEAVIELLPRRVLDLGCGEGWLTRTLANAGINVVGVDASAPLIERARAKGGSYFELYSFMDIVADPSRAGGEYDVIACNFSLLEEELTPLLRALHNCMAEGGKLVVQTVHPWTARDGEPYCDGWRTESFARVGEEFTEPMPWYYRTLESWVRLLENSGYVLTDLREPVHPETREPLSLLLVASRG